MCSCQWHSRATPPHALVGSVWRTTLVARYTKMRISAVSPLPTTSSAEYLGGLPGGQGLSPRLSIHLPISADLNSGQVVQKVAVSRQHGCTSWPGSTTCTPRTTPFKGRNIRRLDSAPTRSPDVPPCQPVTVSAWPRFIIPPYPIPFSLRTLSHKTSATAILPPFHGPTDAYIPAPAPVGGAVASRLLRSRGHSGLAPKPSPPTLRSTPLRGARSPPAGIPSSASAEP